ncbi:MAG TPA: cation diffusion facilitator family transporter [Syntrophorhabdaceae bacterium]|nr:cation diffusion facilitator family transporter [Syntrophorhabdaceae bacterium]
MDIKYKASFFAVVMAVVLAICKFIIGSMSGSMAVISSGLDSLLDVFMSGMNLYAIKRASMPADDSHQYGHGKIEDFAAVIESLVIIGVGAIIIYNAVIGFIQEIRVQYTLFDIPVMILSLVVSLVVSFVLKRTSYKTDSLALKADAVHYTSDIYSNLGAILAIILTYYTGYSYFDFAFAIIIGFIIIVSALRVFKDGISGLMDKSITDKKLKEIRDIIETMPFPYAGFHKLRTRTAGSKKYIDFHLLLCRKSNIKDAHEISETLEDEIKRRSPSIDITIHLEPCDKDCNMTEDTCAVKNTCKDT